MLKFILPLILLFSNSSYAAWTLQTIIYNGEEVTVLMDDKRAEMWRLEDGKWIKMDGPARTEPLRIQMGTIPNKPER